MKLFELDTLMDQNIYGGDLSEDYAYVWLWRGRYDVSGFTESKEHFLLEAWERQTTGGIGGTVETRPFRHFMSKDGRKVVHEQYADATC